MYIDFLFWLRQQPPETQQWTILALIGEFAIMFILGIIEEYIKSKREMSSCGRRQKVI